MRKPNFFILGAPKCGTTSLTAWLSRHPNVFMSSYKEPHFFNTDDDRVVNTVRHYQSFFRGAGPQHQAIGEASVWYLSSICAVLGILEYQPDARFIVMLRNPVEMAPSLHSEMLFTGMETEHDFAIAWDLQDVRRCGQAIPVSCSVPRRLLYGDACLLGAQLGRLLARVPSERVLTILMDDLRVNARSEYLRVLQFLGVPDDGRSDFTVKNAAQICRWPSLVRLSHAITAGRARLGITGGIGFWSRVDAMNRKSQSRNGLSPKLKAALAQFFSPDVRQLGYLLNRNLDHWLTC